MSPTSAAPHIEPPLGEHWSEDEKLAWHAAVTVHDTGLRIRVVRFDSGYNLVVHGDASNSSAGDFSYLSAWTYLSGIHTGVLVTRHRS